MKKILLSTVAVLALNSSIARAAIDVKLGILSDMSGLYADVGGPGSIEAVKMALEDFDAAKNGLNVEVLSADHQNKPDVGSSIARQWFDADHVDAIVDVPNSGVALAINNIARDKNKVFLVSGAALSDLTGKSCSPNTVHWTYDTWAMAHGTGHFLVRLGGKKWFFLAADYAAGYALEHDTAEVVKAAGGQVLGTVRHPLNTGDFSSFLLQAQASKPDVIALANAGGDTVNSIKQTAEFGIVQSGQKLAGLVIFITDVHSMGLQTAQGLVLTTAFYWDLDDKTRAFARRFAKRNGNKYPTMVQAGVYSETLRYLEAVKKVGSAADGAKIVAAMKGIEYDDPLFGKTTIREDGRAVHRMYLVEVKKPSESKEAWDYYKILTEIPADLAFRPLADEKGVCPLVK